MKKDQESGHDQEENWVLSHVATIAHHFGVSDAASAGSPLVPRGLRTLDTPNIPSGKCVIGEYCCDHGFIHGAEAEELRWRFEKLLEDTKWDDVGRPLRQMMRGLLDDVDARDSAAFVSTPEGVKPS